MSDDFARARARHFAELYAGSDDPWRFRTSAYEAEKYDATIAALTRPRYRAALELGCSIGELTVRLAECAAEVTGVDLSERAIALAQERLAAIPHARAERMTAPEEWPDGRWDLFVISEVLYYLSETEIDALAARVAGARIAPAEIVLVSWSGPADTALSAAEARTIFTRCLRRHMEFETIRPSEHPSYEHHTLLENLREA